MSTNNDIEKERPVIGPQREMTPDELASKVRYEFTCAQRAHRVMLIHMLRCGSWLLRAKAEIPYGSFGDWLANKAGISPAQAYRMMELADKYVDLDEPQKKRLHEAKSFREILRIVGVKMGEAKVKASPPVKRGGDCTHRGCTRPGSSFGFCSHHFIEGLIAELQYVSREELQTLFNFLKTTLEVSDVRND